MKKRNPKRIINVLKKVRQYWELNPDLRLSQLLDNLAWDETDSYYIEDELLVQRINIKLDEQTKRA